VSLEGSITPRVSLRYKARHGQGKEPHRKGVVKASWSHLLRRWLRLERTIDREADLYEETVYDPESDDVIHHQREPLSQHTNHGDAKRHPTQKKDDTRTA